MINRPDVPVFYKNRLGHVPIYCDKCHKLLAFGPVLWLHDETEGKRPKRYPICMSCYGGFKNGIQPNGSLWCPAPNGGLLIIKRAASLGRTESFTDEDKKFLKECGIHE